MTNGNLLLIYDGDCGFCEQTARLVSTWASGRVETQPWQHIPQRLAAAGLTAGDAQEQVWAVRPDGRRRGGAAAVNEALSLVWWARPLTWLYRLPGPRGLEERVYRWVALNRYRLPGGRADCEIKSPSVHMGR